MTATIQDIQTVLSLRKTLREPTAPSPILALIDSIHHSLSIHSDHHGWKTVDWRGNGSGGNGGGNNNRSNAPSRGNYNSNRNRESSFGNRSRSSHEPNPNTISPPTTSPRVETSTPPPTTATSSKHHTWQDNTDGFRHPHQKYVSKFKKTSGKVEDTILNTILLGKLNKFSQSNYTEIKEFITVIIDDGQTEMIKCFMKLVFEKAASEEMFCPLYARLLSELTTQYPILLTEMANLYTQYMEIFDEVSEDIASETYNELCKRNVEKKYRRGYSQFLAELIKHDVIDGDTFMKSINKIMTQVEAKRTCSNSIKLNEEFADCLMKIIKAICNDESESDDDEMDVKMGVFRNALKDTVAVRIQPLTIRNPDAVGLSNKARFTFLDIYERIQKH